MLHRRHHNRLKQILYISISITASPANKSPNVSLLVNLIPLIVLHVHPVFHLDKKDKETNLKFCPKKFSKSTECKKKKKKMEKQLTICCGYIQGKVFLSK